MTRASFTVLFYIKRTKELKDGMVPIYARITLNGQRAEYDHQKSTDENQWDSKKEQPQQSQKPEKKKSIMVDTLDHLCFPRHHRRSRHVDAIQQLGSGSLRQGTFPKACMRYRIGFGYVPLKVEL